MNRWPMAVIALAALGLQGCDRSPPVTTVVPPTASLPDDAVLTPGARATAPAPAAPVAAAPVAPSEPVAAAPATPPEPVAAAPVTAPEPVAVAPVQPPAATPGTQAMGAPAAGTAAPTELSPGASGRSAVSPKANPDAAASPSSPASSPQKLSSALPQVRSPGDAQGARLLAQRSLEVPVSGIVPTRLADNYEQSRGKRTHEAIDILAPAGTPVVAVDDGRIAKLFTSKPGGLTIYQYDVPSQLAYYYAHLQRYADGVREGMDVKRGQLIGYVGSTGNADPGTPHLHFAVFRLNDPPKWWQGEAVNPYPALSRAAPGQAVASR